MLRHIRNEKTLQYKQLVSIDEQSPKKKALQGKATHAVKVKRERHGVLGEKKKLKQESYLEKLVFGNTSEFFHNLELQTKPKKVAKQHLPRKKKDKVPEDPYGIYEEEKRKPVWFDEDDVRVTDVPAEDRTGETQDGSENPMKKCTEKLQKKFISIHGTPKWADRNSTKKKDDDDFDNEFTQKVGNYLVTKSDRLPKKMLQYKKMKDLNNDLEKERSNVKALEFHPTQKVALLALYHGDISLVQVDGNKNSKIQTVHFERFPVNMAHFTQNGNQFIVTSRSTASFQYYDLLAGKVLTIPKSQHFEEKVMQKFEVSPDGKIVAFFGQYGNIHLLSSSTKEWICSLKMNGEILALTFNSDGSRMYSFGDDGEVCVWDMGTRMCVQKFVDDGCLCGTSIALSTNQQFLACGQQSGVVNVYDTATLGTTMYPKPVNSILNLVTAATLLKFNCTSEILAMTSNEMNNAIKLVHFPSMTVFQNFPEIQRHYKPLVLDMSPNSGYLGIGTTTGAMSLYRLLHYGSY